MVRADRWRLIERTVGKREKEVEAERGWEFWDAAKVTLIKRAKREEVATDNEKRQKETKRLRERLIERDGNS